MRKYDFISALAKETAAEVVKNREEWMKYLTTAARLYKYPFREQLLIYAQRPDATACASIELWNERMHCWVNKGAKGIALLDEDDAHGKRLKYVFDVSDVHAARRIGRYPELWELHEEHKEDVIKRLEHTYGATDDKKLFEERLITKYGMMRETYLKENHRGVYSAFLLKGTLKEHLLTIQKQAEERMEKLTSQMAATEGVTEQLKEADQMLWVAKMNSIRNRAEEVVLGELVYSL